MKDTKDNFDELMHFKGDDIPALLQTWSVPEIIPIAISDPIIDLPINLEFDRNLKDDGSPNFEIE